MNMDTLFVIIDLQTRNGLFAIWNTLIVDKEGDLLQVMQIINLEVASPLLWVVELR